MEASRAAAMAHRTPACDRTAAAIVDAVPHVPVGPCDCALTVVGYHGCWVSCVRHLFPCARLQPDLAVMIALYLRRLLPFLPLVAHKAITTRRGSNLVQYSTFDALLLTQKLAPCLLRYTSLDAYSGTLPAIGHCALVFTLWLRLRPHRSPDARTAVLLLFTCVLGLQGSVLVAGAQWAPNASPASPVTRWRDPFLTAVLVYVVCCLVWYGQHITSVAVTMFRGPRLEARRPSLHKSVLTNSVWIRELDSFNHSGARSGDIGIRNPLASALSRKTRVASLATTASRAMQAVTTNDDS